MLSVRKTVFSMLSKTLSEQLSNLLSLMLSTCFICVTLPKSMGTIASFAHVDKASFFAEISVSIISGELSTFFLF